MVDAGGMCSSGVIDKAQASVFVALPNQLLVYVTGVIVSPLGFTQLGDRNPGRLLRPTLIHSIQTPFRALT